MSRLVLVLGDQLTRDLSSLRDLDPARDHVLMVEVAEEATYVPHHRQKIALIFSAMRHFAAALRAEGVRVDYITLDAEANSGSFTGELERAIVRHRPARIVVSEPGEWRVLAMMQGWAQAFGVPVEIRPDDRFFCTPAAFAQWAEGRKTLRMELFYREMRQKTGLLMMEGAPLGGQWNYDHDNRKPLPAGKRPPPRQRFEPDAMTQEVLALVAARFGDHFGDLEPFGWGVTRADALEALDHFIGACLPAFGDFQDAMKQDEPFLFHSLIAPYLNLGLLTAREVCDAACAALARGEAPLNAVEGFVRQILGWREFVRGLYWLKMPGYARSNALGAQRPLPWFYWSGETALNCVAQVVRDTRRHAYAHHIQRLMVTGNFALLAGIDPAQVEAWYLAVYADAYEWVELPNVHGMALFADGGAFASKPYAASGAYIHRMSDYCAGCAYAPQVRSGPRACPFNLLYWHFLARNRAVLGRNPRMAMPYRTLDAMEPTHRAAVLAQAEQFLNTLEGNAPPAPPPADQLSLFAPT